MGEREMGELERLAYEIRYEESMGAWADKSRLMRLRRQYWREKSEISVGAGVPATSETMP